MRPGSKGRFSGLAEPFCGVMFRSALRSREKLVAETFLVDKIQVHTVSAVSFIDIFRVDGPCLEG